MPNAPRIELPRPAIIAAFGVLVLAATFLLTHNKTSSSPVSTPASTSSTSTTATNTGTTTTTSTSTGTTTTPTQTQPAVTPSQGLPAAVATALDRHQVVVLFFYEPSAADDQATRAAVRAVRSVSGARLFSDTVSRISNYSRVVGNLGITQVPAMVVIDKQRNARLFEGFLDAGSIKQSVRDAL